MQRDEIRIGKQSVELDLLSRRVELAVLDEGIGVEDAHTESRGPDRDLPGDIAEPDQAQRSAGEAVDRLAWRHLPAPGAHQAVVERDLARAREQQRHRMLGDFLDAVGRVVGDDDAGAGRRLEVDGVDADAVARDDPALGHSVHDVPGDGPGVGVQERVAVGSLPEKLLRLLGLHRDQLGEAPERLLLDVERFPHVIGDDDLGLHCIHLTTPATPSTATVAPSGMRCVAPGTPSTIGTPRSRASDARWEVLPPSSATTPATCASTGPSAGPATVVTSTSPGATRSSSHSQLTTRARPSAQPIPEGCPSSFGCCSQIASGTLASATRNGRAWRSLIPVASAAHSISTGPPMTSSLLRISKPISATCSASRQREPASARDSDFLPCTQATPWYFLP